MDIQLPTVELKRMLELERFKLGGKNKVRKFPLFQQRGKYGKIYSKNTVGKFL
jgi:hypothetical protein